MVYGGGGGGSFNWKYKCIGGTKITIGIPRALDSSGDRQECKSTKRTERTDDMSADYHGKQDTRRVSIDHVCVQAHYYKKKAMKYGLPLVFRGFKVDEFLVRKTSHLR